ncbi:MAG: tetratricopeptide repeat protein [Salibacteraceae bacterium]
MRLLISRIALFVVLAGLMVACTPTNPEEKAKKEVEEARKVILEERDKLLDSTGPLDTARSEMMIDRYITFVQNNPADTDAGEFLFQAASLCMAKGDYERCIKIHQNLLNNYPNNKRTVESTFHIAFTYDTYLDKKGMAEDWYKKVIKEFPRDDLALQSRSAIKNLNMTDEELIKMFEEKNK